MDAFFLRECSREVSKIIRLEESVANVWGWLQTWLDSRGGLHGYIVHHHRDNLKMLSPDTWTQSAAILGLLNLCEKTGNKRWLDLSSKLSKLLIARYIPERHVFQNSNHEQKPLGRPALISNALPTYALLRVAERKRENGDSWDQYYDVAKDNLNCFLFPLWNEDVGAFSSPIHDRPVFVHNMNSIMILVLNVLSEIEDQDSYVTKYSTRIAEHILRCQVKDGQYCGAYPYSDRSKNYITLYSLITSIGLLDLWEKTHDKKLSESLEQALLHLSDFVDKRTGLICHLHRKGYPQWVPDSLLVIYLAKKFGKPDPESRLQLGRMLTAILEKQHNSGGFPLSIGFEDLWFKAGCPSNPSLKRWRDILPTPNWNAWNFWMLTEILPIGAKIPTARNTFPSELKTDPEEDEGPYRIKEYRDKVIISEIHNSRVVGIFRKKSEIADLCIIQERGEYWRFQSSLSRYPPIISKMLRFLLMR